MVSLLEGERADERRRRRLWSVAVPGVFALCIAGTKASAAFRDIRVPGAETSRAPPRPTEPLSAADRAQLEQFASSIVKNVDAMWAHDFRRRAKPYTPAEPVLLAVPEKSDCGPGITLGRSDCFGTNKAFIDLSFQQALTGFGENAEGAQAYAIAHELGHHVQRVLGLDEKVAALLEKKPVASHWVDVQLELQADCLAGVWTRRTQQQHLVGPTQIEASIRQTSELGTARRLAEASDAASVGETFAYAIPRRRIYWFAQGYAHGEIDDCDTFAP